MGKRRKKKRNKQQFQPPASRFFQFLSRERLYLYSVMVSRSFNFFLLFLLFEVKLNNWIKRVYTHKQMLWDISPATEGKNNSNKRRRSIADELMLDILSRVPSRSLIRFRCVCKLWNSLFRDSYFISLQLSHAVKNPATFIYQNYGHQICVQLFKIEAGEVVLPYSKFSVAVENRKMDLMSNACDGLIAFHDFYHVHVVNPCTREWMATPDTTPHELPNSVNENPSLGFGFCMATGKYKLVRIFCRDRVSWSCEILTLGIDRSWRLLGDAPCRVVCNVIPTYANGFIYWTIADDIAASMGILSFDVYKEKFTMEFHPQPFGVYRRLCMTAYEGSLCLFHWTVYAFDNFDEARLSYLPKEDSVWKEIGSIKVHDINIKNLLFPCLRHHIYHYTYPVAIEQGKVILDFGFRAFWLHDLRTGASSWIPLHALNKGLTYRAQPFACAQSIIPLDWLKIPEYLF